MSKLKCIHEPESNECASVKKTNWFLYSKYLISFFAIYFWANEKVTACENNDQGLVSTMITLKKKNQYCVETDTHRLCKTLRALF